MWYKLAALVFSLGLDTLLVSVSLGASGLSSARWRLAITFAAFEALMPIVGLLVGHELTVLLGGWSHRVGPALLIAVGLYLMGEPFLEWLEERRERGRPEGGTEQGDASPDDDDDDDDDEKDLGRWHNLVGWGIIAVGLSISFDELVVGLSLGMLGLPIPLTILLIAAQAALATLLGLQVGARLRHQLSEAAEIPAGLVLTLLGIYLLLA